MRHVFAARLKPLILKSCIVYNKERRVFKQKVGNNHQENILAREKTFGAFKTYARKVLREKEELKLELEAEPD